jgi:pentatricopeptide repeat protein
MKLHQAFRFSFRPITRISFNNVKRISSLQSYSSEDTSECNVQEIYRWHCLMTESLKHLDYPKAESVYLQMKPYERGLLERSGSSLLSTDLDGYRNYRKKNVDDFEKFSYIYVMFLGICKKKEHLHNVLDILSYLRLGNIALTEQCYQALMRCYSDSDQVFEVLRIMNQMKEQSISLKYRNFLPLFQFFSRHHDLTGFLSAINNVYNENLLLKLDDILLFFKTIAAAKNNHFQQFNNSSSHEKFYLGILPLINSTIARICEKEFHGMNTSDLTTIMLHFNGNNTDSDGSMEQIRNSSGILVNSVKDLPNAIVNDDNYDDDGSVISLNEVFDHPRKFIDNFHHHHNHYHHSQSNDQQSSVEEKKKAITKIPLPDFATIQLNSMKFIDTHKRDKILSSLVKDFPVETLNENGNHGYEKIPKVMRWLKDKNADARFVYISGQDSRCPHCQGELMKFHLSENHKSLIRNEIYRRIIQSSPEQAEPLQVTSLFFKVLFSKLISGFAFRTLKNGLKIRSMMLSLTERM